MRSTALLVLMAVTVAACLGAAPDDADPGIASAHRGGTSGAWLWRDGSRTAGVGSTTVPSEGGVDRTTVVDEGLVVAGHGVAATVPLEESRADEAVVTALAELADVSLVLAGHRVEVSAARAEAVARCNADGSVDLRTSSHLGEVTIDGTVVHDPHQQLLLGPVQLVVGAQDVDPVTGDARIIALAVTAGPVRVTLASAWAGIDCRPAE